MTTARDEYQSRAPERSGARAERHEPPPAASPFDGIARGAPGREAALPPVSTEPQGLATELELPLAAMEALASALAAGVPAGDADRILVGSMLVASETPALPEGAGPVVRAVVEGDGADASRRFAAWLENGGPALEGARRNVQALVQRVLREAYLLGTETLRDYAAKVERYNEERKKVRELLERARATRTTWSAQSKAAGGELVADAPFEAREVDPDTGEVFTPITTAEDVARWQAQESARRSQAPSDVFGQLEILDGASRLDGADTALLEEMVTDKDGFFSRIFDSNDDDYIRDHLDELTGILPRASGAQLERYLPRILDILSGGNTDEDAILAVFGALTPPQMMHVVAGGSSAGATTVWPGDGFGGLDAGEKADLRQLATEAAEAVAGSLGSDFTGKLTPQGARSLLADLRRAASTRRSPAADTPPEVGAPRTIRTLEEMDAYTEGLEERLNSIGDDAQLANVDLQNELQKELQLLQTMSNVSKMLHETALAVIRKMGG